MKVGIQQLKVIFTALVDAVCCVDKLAAHDGVFAIFQYTGDFSALGAVSKDEVIAECKDLDASERAELETLVKSKLVLHNASMQAKLNEGVDVLEAVVTAGLRVYAEVQAEVKLDAEVVAQVKKLVGA